MPDPELHSLLGNSRESKSRTYLNVFIYLFIHREERRLEANHFNEEVSYLAMQNKILHDTATFQFNIFKNELPNKEC